MMRPARDIDARRGNHLDKFVLEIITTFLGCFNFFHFSGFILMLSSKVDVPDWEG